MKEKIFIKRIFVYKLHLNSKVTTLAVNITI